jgi:neutral ceramidase
MTPRIRLLATLAAAAALPACSLAPMYLPPAESPAPAARDSGGLHAGFARVDITPPPGPALIGYGPEGKQARGYRGRLYARAMVLEDRWGQRFAIVGLDLGMPSVLLHRRVAALTADSTVRIGADRLVLAATHTHGGPGNFFGVPGIDAFASTRSGFDERLTDFLVARIESAVRQAALDLRPARALWSVQPVWGWTRIRSFPAYQGNQPPWRSPYPAPAGLDDAQQGVDPAWRMLRVDVRDPATGRFEPRGAFSLFAIHGTAVPNANDLFDPDVHGIVSRAMEEHIGRAGGRGGGTQRHGVHLFANGAEGDVSPNLPPGTRCEVPKMGRARRLSGPRAHPHGDVWLPVPDSALDRCMRLAKLWTDSLGRALASAAMRQYEALGVRMDSLEGAGQAEVTRGLRIERAFGTLPLLRSTQDRDVCSPPRVGTSFVGGAEDGRTRVYGWRFLGIFKPGFGARQDTLYPGFHACHAQKRIALGPLQGLLAGPNQLPEVAELTAVRIGEMLIGTFPGEPTTTVGGRIRQAMAHHAGMHEGQVMLMGLANGYVQYVTTPEEYRWQFYEGGATEYGPRSAIVFQEALSRLAATLRPGAGGTAPARVNPLTAYRQQGLEDFPPPRGPGAARIDRRFREVRWRGDTLVARWNDLHPGRLIPADGPLLAIERRSVGGAWEVVTWDDDHELEVRARRSLGALGYEWEARWRPCRRGAGGAYRVVLLPRDTLPRLDGPELADAPPPGCAAEWGAARPAGEEGTP